MNRQVATPLAMLALMGAPTLLAVMDGDKNEDDASGEVVCVVRADAPVERRFGGEKDVAANLAKGTEVTVLSSRDELRRIAYPHADGGARIGWIAKDDLGSCAQPVSASAAVREPHPFGRPLGEVAGGRLLRKIGYDCMHDPALRYCRWVGYCFSPSEVAVKRHKGFFADKDLPSDERAEPADYDDSFAEDRSGFDRGHMAPDATIKVLGEEAQKETYSLANITPQHTETNQGIWRRLEDEIRKWATAAEPVCVETGPIFEANRPVRRLQTGNRLQVPHAYYAIVTRGSATGPDVLGFVVPNDPKRRSFDDAMTFVRSVDTIERATGFDFLSALSPDIEDSIEAETPTDLW